MCLEAGSTICRIKSLFQHIINDTFERLGDETMSGFIVKSDRYRKPFVTST
jgi:hypothetical protein